MIEIQLLYVDVVMRRFYKLTKEGGRFIKTPILEVNAVLVTLDISFKFVGTATLQNRTHGT